MNRRLLAHFGSLRTALALMALLGLVVLLRPQFAFLAPAFALLALSLLAALVVHPLLRRQFALLVFHLALLALLALVAWGRLSALDGRFELTQGVPFDGTLLDSEAGPLHAPRLHRLAFRNDGFEIDYAPGRKRGATRNAVSWTGDDGTPRSAVIGDHKPLVLAGHRIYTSPNKGFAPVLQWRPARGAPVTGAVHLPSFPAHELRQSHEWTLPDGRAAWIQLRIDETLLDPAAAGSFRLPGAHRLIVRVGAQRAELAPGESLVLDGGALVYAELRTWMGYRVAYDPTLPWLLVAALLAAVALGWHYARKALGAPEPAAAAALGGLRHG